MKKINGRAVSDELIAAHTPPRPTRLAAIIQTMFRNGLPIGWNKPTK